MRLYHDASEHIQEAIKAKYDRRISAVLDEADKEAEHIIRDAETAADRRGQAIYDKRRRRADRDTRHDYHERREALRSTVQAKRQALKTELLKEVWRVLEDKVTLEDTHAYLAAQLDSVEPDTDGYQGETLRDAKVVATTPTKKYEASLADNVEDAVNKYWSSLP